MEFFFLNVSIFAPYYVMVPDAVSFVLGPVGSFEALCNVDVRWGVEAGVGMNVV